MKAFFKFIRVVTVAPLIAAATVTLLYFFGNGIFKDTFHYFAALLTLTFFPLLAYPLSLIKPSETRRGFQRSAAIVFSVAGYIAGLVFALVSGAPAGEKTVYFTYLLSGIIIALSSFVFKYKSSGHTCGIAGPVSLLVYYINPVYALGFLFAASCFSCFGENETPHALAACDRKHNTRYLYVHIPIDFLKVKSILKTAVFL